MEPKLRFKEFSGELAKDKFKNLIKLQRGSSPRPISKYITTKEDGVNWIKIGDISKEDNVIKGTKEKITKEGAKKSRYVKKGDLILSNSMSFGRPYLLEIDGYIHDGWFVLKEYEKNFNRNYLCQLLSSDVVQNQYKKIAAGGVVSNISSDLVNSVEVNIPSLSEQTKIADFLSTVDEKIQNQQDKITHLENIKKGFMQKIFSRKIRFKDANGNEFPEWEEKKLKDCCEYQSSSVSTSMILENANYELFDANGKIGYTDSFCDKKYISIIKDGAGVGRTRILPKNSFCISTMGIITSNKYSVIEYLYYMISQLDFIKYIVGATIPHIYFKDYGNEKIELPCLEEQQKIADFLSSFDDKIDAEKETLEHLKELKKGLLQQMFV